MIEMMSLFVQFACNIINSFVVSAKATEESLSCIVIINSNRINDI